MPAKNAAKTTQFEIDLGITPSGYRPSLVDPNADPSIRLIIALQGVDGNVERWSAALVHKLWTHRAGTALLVDAPSAREALIRARQVLDQALTAIGKAIATNAIS